MNVILLEKIGKLGTVGDTAAVKAGYARNFLFPRGKAIPATRDNVKHFEERRAELMRAHNEKVAVAEARAEKLKDFRITIAVNASEEGKLYGSVGTRDIVNAAAEAGAEIEKSEIRLPHGVIRETGEYPVSLDLGHEIEQDITVVVVPA